MMKTVREHWLIASLFVGIWTAMAVTPPGAFLPMGMSHIVSSAQANPAPCVQNPVQTK